MDKKWIILVIAALAALLVAFIIWVIWGNTALEMNRYTIKSPNLPESFNGYKIAQISDLHNAQMGENNETLLHMLRECDPDIITITGDIVDSRHTDLDVAIQFVTEAVKIAPCYYVTGNHEARLEEYEELRKAMEAVGVIVLADESVCISRGDSNITLIGMNDPAFFDGYHPDLVELLMEGKLSELCSKTDGYTILLAHRPHLFETYTGANVDLVLSGHAHGGQFRLPFIGGVYVPSQGLFPEYDAGLYTEGNTQMIVSRGIGNSVFPFRLNNRPEIILIELYSS